MAVQTPQQFAQSFGMLPPPTPPPAPANPAQQFIAHITTVGERWDLIAWNYYGDPTRYSPIVLANPAVPIEAVFEAGRQLMIPILPPAAASEQDLPPWETL
jgi:hypothetical protein